jgi:inosine/uridine nucleosidase
VQVGRRCRRIQLRGITAVSGNHNVENTMHNALAVCTACGLRVPVAKGSPGPLVIDQVLALPYRLHGSAGKCIAMWLCN